MQSSEALYNEPRQFAEAQSAIYIRTAKHLMSIYLRNERRMGG